MAMTAEWDRVVERLSALKQFRRFRPTIAAMLGLVEALRQDSRLGDVVPGLSHATLSLRLRDHQRYVMVSWDERDPQGFEVSFVDPPLEFSGTRKVPKTEVVATILDYLEQMRRSR